MDLSSIIGWVAGIGLILFIRFLMNVFGSIFMSFGSLFDASGGTML